MFTKSALRDGQHYLADLLTPLLVANPFSAVRGIVAVVAQR
jgi:hypothetical protein